MKNILFKSVCLVLLCCGAALTANAQGIVVTKTDGTKVYYKATEVLSVGVYGYGDDPVEGLHTHEYVNLGLPSGTLWATCNVGAEKPEEYGDYFTWGETAGYNSGKTTFSWATYRYYDALYNTLTKYCTKSDYGTIDDKTELEMVDDAATANWGSNWQMPSNDQLLELINSNYTTTSWTTLNGVNGRLIVSKSNGNRIFLPAAGYHSTSLYSAGSGGYYWSRSLYTSNSMYARGLGFSSSSISTDTHSRYYGRSVRPVRVKE